MAEREINTAVDTRDLDLRGYECPYTFVYTRLEMERMQTGARLRVLVDHERAARNVPRSVREWGQIVERVSEIDKGLWEIVIVKAD